MESFVDYFHLFNLGLNAEQSAIEAHYKTLCKQFHPDLNHAPGAEDRMKEINIAYEVLGNAERRRAYTREWLRRNAAARPMQRRAISAAHTVMEQYFLSLSQGMYGRAYDLLSARDKRGVSFASFAEWQKSVSEVYTIKSFSVRGDRIYDSYTLDDQSVCAAERFVIEIVEENKISGQLSRYDFRKFAIQSQDAWGVFLGYRDLSSISERLRYIADMGGGAEAHSGWAHYRDTMHPIYGIANRRGFVERCAPEVYRQARYKRPFSIGVVRVDVDGGPGDGEKGKVCAFAAHALKRMLRAIDIPGALSDDTFCVLLAEANAAAAKKVFERLGARIAREVWHSFDLRATVEYTSCECGGDVSKALDRCVYRLKDGRGALPQDG